MTRQLNQASRVRKLTTLLGTGAPAALIAPQRPPAFYNLARHPMTQATQPINPKHVKPRTNHVFVELDVKPGSTPGGLALPDSARQKQQDRLGTILAVGPDVPPDLQAGVRVVVNFFEGTNVTLDYRDSAERYKVLPADNVKATIDS